VSALCRGRSESDRCASEAQESLLDSATTSTTTVALQSLGMGRSASGSRLLSPSIKMPLVDEMLSNRQMGEKERRREGYDMQT